MSFMNDGIPSSGDRSKAKLVLWDLRLKDEVMQWPLHDCGDKAVNATAFEECDYMASPNPIVDNDYVYPTNDQYDQHSTTTGATNPQGTTFPSPSEIFWDLTTKKYYTCSTICLRQEVALCGDGVPSNGKPSNVGFTNQDSGTSRVLGDDGYE